MASGFHKTSVVQSQKDMTNTLLIRTFRQLTPKDLRILRERVRCASFNRRDDVARLCDHLCTHIHKANQKSLTAGHLHSAAFPDVPYNNANLRQTMTILLQVVREYLAWAEWNADEIEQQRWLLRALRKRSMEQMFEKEWAWSMGEVERHSTRDAAYHHGQYQTHLELVEFMARNERSSRLNLQPLPDQLTTYYISEMLRLACQAHVHEAVAGQTYRFDLLQVILEAAGRDEMLQSPAVALYYYAYHMLIRPDDTDSFMRLKAALAAHESCFSPSEMRNLYLMAINGCIRRMNAGRREYVKEAFDLYKKALERNFLIENGFLSGFSYKNIIRIGISLGEKEWTLDFLETHRASLHPRERDNLYRYNLASVYFRTQDYAKAMPLLLQVDFEDPLNNLDARRMLLRSYVELKEWEALRSHLHTFGAYLKRQKNLGYHRANNENLIHFTKKWMELDKTDTAAVQQLRAEVMATTELAERDWLLGQLVI